MKVAVDLTYNPYGGSYSQIENILKFLQDNEEHNYIFYCTKLNFQEFKQYQKKHIIFKVSKVSSLSRFARIIWTQFILPIQVLFDDVSVLFCPGNFSPVFSYTKKVQWIGTVGPFEKKFYKGFSFIEKINLYINKYVMIASALTSTHVIFESKYTQELFINNYNFNGSRSSVITLGRDEFYSSKLSSNSGVTKDYRDKKFLLVVSHLYPYKNIEILFHALKKINDPELKCLIAGKFHTKSYFHKLTKLSNNLSLNDKVVFLGGVNRRELKDLYSNCEMLVFTSPFENFAYTLVEAMSCGTAIIAAEATAMPETCKNAALYFDPYSPDELSQQINYFLSDKSLLKEYKNRALKRAQEINTYQEANLKTLQIVQSLMEDKKESL